MGGEVTQDLQGGQTHLWIKNGVKVGAILLLKPMNIPKDPAGGLQQGWVVERVPTTAPLWVPRHQIGPKLNAMEVLAWAAK